MDRLATPPPTGRSDGQRRPAPRAGSRRGAGYVSEVRQYFEKQRPAAAVRIAAAFQDPFQFPGRQLKSLIFLAGLISFTFDSTSCAGLECAPIRQRPRRQDYLHDKVVCYLCPAADLSEMPWLA